MRRLGIECPIYSIRTPSGEPGQNFPPELDGRVTYLPQDFEGILSDDADFRRKARRGIADLRKTWGSQSEKKRIYEALWLIPRLREAGVRHVHSHFAGTAARTAFWLHRLAGIRFSITAHANDVFCDEPPERLASMFGAAQAIVTVSDYSARLLKSQFPAGAAKVHRVYNGIDVARFHRDSPDARKPIILGVGRFIEKKGFDDLIAACGELDDLEFQCRVIGEGPLEDDLKSRAASVSGRGSVEIVGPRAEREIVEEMANAAVFALPCRMASDGGMDNLPTVIMEAMASGLPVVSTRLAGIPEMVEDGVTGFLVEPGDISGIASAIRELMRDPARARQMGRAGRERCGDMFSTVRTTARLKEVLENCRAFEPGGRSIFERLFRGNG